MADHDWPVGAPRGTQLIANNGWGYNAAFIIIA